MKATILLGLSFGVLLAACASTREPDETRIPARPPILPAVAAPEADPSPQTIGGKGKGTETRNERVITQAPAPVPQVARPVAITRSRPGPH